LPPLAVDTDNSASQFWCRRAGSLRKAQIPLVASRHDTTRQARRVVSCVLHRACSNMGDVEEAVVLACKIYYVLLLFIISAHKWN